MRAAFGLAWLALRGLEGARAAAGAADDAARPLPGRFRRVLAETWSDAPARRFTVFVFVSMLAFSAQDLILEPPSLAWSSVGRRGRRPRWPACSTAGCWRACCWWPSPAAWAGFDAGLVRGRLPASGAAPLALAGTGWAAQPDALRPVVDCLGAANGALSIAAIGTMMRMAGEGGGACAGVRMGLWGAAQALAFALGGLLGAAGSDLTPRLAGPGGAGLRVIFTLEAALFVVAAAPALGIAAPGRARLPARPSIRRSYT